MPTTQFTIQTNAQARAALGVTSTWIRKAYAINDTIQTNNPLDITAFAVLRKSTKELLDRTNTEAQKVYKLIPANGGPISAVLLARTRAVITAASGDLKIVARGSDELSQSFLQEIANKVLALAATPAGFNSLVVVGVLAFVLLARRR